MDDTIISAISELRLLEFRYKGSSRIVEPHLFGLSTKGSKCLSAFQLTGGSGISFRQFHIDEMSAVTALDEKFEGPRPDFNPADRSFLSVIASL